MAQANPTPRTYRRLPNWERHLAAHIAACRHRPFAWGSHDCCQFWRQGVIAMTATDPQRGWRIGRYTTQHGAARILARIGGIAALPAKLGCQPVPLAFARRGDLAIHDGAMGLCLGQTSAFPGPAGLEFILTLNCDSTWRVF